MAKALPKYLTRRRGAHKFLSWVASLRNRWDGFRDARKALKAKRKKH